MYILAVYNFYIGYYLETEKLTQNKIDNAADNECWHVISSYET